MVSSVEIGLTVVLVLMLLFGVIGLKFAQKRNNSGMSTDEAQRRRAEAYRLRREREAEDAELSEYMDTGYSEDDDDSEGVDDEEV